MGASEESGENLGHHEKHAVLGKEIESTNRKMYTPLSNSEKQAFSSSYTCKLCKHLHEGRGLERVSRLSYSHTLYVCVYSLIITKPFFLLFLKVGIQFFIKSLVKTNRIKQTLNGRANF